MAKLLRVRAFMPDGTAVLEDNREMQVVVNANTGALGVRSKTNEDRLGVLDQYVGPPGQEPVAALPTMAELNLDQ